MTAPFSKPNPPGAGIDLKPLTGALLLVDVHALEQGIQTTFGPTDAVRADVTVLDGPLAGERYRDTLLFPKVLQQQLRGQIGQKVLGRLGTGAAKPGQSAPWVLAEATDQDTKVAVAHLAQTTVSSAAPPF